MYENALIEYLEASTESLSLEYRNNDKKTKNSNNMKKIIEELYETSKER
ncbi:MAG: hypothetical protein ACR5K2_05255 [Wolbachia sp.]